MIYRVFTIIWRRIVAGVYTPLKFVTDISLKRQQLADVGLITTVTTDCIVSRESVYQARAIRKLYFEVER